MFRQNHPIFFVLASALTLFICTSASAAPDHISPDILVISDDVVTQQWTHTPPLVNAPLNWTQIEPGQCVRFGVVASGAHRDKILAQATMSYELLFAGKTQTIDAQPPAAIKQIKPAGADFVTQALGAAHLSNPQTSLASLSASAATWCAPQDAQDGTLSVSVTVKAPFIKQAVLGPHSIDIKTFATVRKQISFADLKSLGVWMQRYYAQPDPANLLPAMRIVGRENTASTMPNLTVFFIEALKASPLAANEIMQALPKENHPVMLYNLKVLNGAGYKTGTLLAGLSADENAKLSAFRLPDPDDRTTDRSLPRRMDMLWAQFFATGRFEPIQKIVSFLGWHDDFEALIAQRKANPGKPPAFTDSVMRGIVYVTAGWSLNALSHTNPLLEDYYAAIEAAPGTPANVKSELAGLHTNPRFIRK